MSSKKNTINTDPRKGFVNYRALQGANSLAERGSYLEAQEKEFSNKVISNSNPYANAGSYVDTSQYLNGSANPLGSSQWDKEDGIYNDYELENAGDIRANNEGWASKIGNGLAKAGVLAGTTFLDGTLGLVYGAGTAIAEGRFSGIWDNEVSKALKSVNDWSENAFANYQTKEEQENTANGEWWKNVGTANFWGDNVIKNIGFTVGAFYSGDVYARGLNILGKAATSMAAKTFQAGAEAAGKIANASEVAQKGVGAFMSAFNEGRTEALNNSTEWKNATMQAWDMKNAGRTQALQEAFQSGQIDEITYRQGINQIASERANYESNVDKEARNMGNLDLALNIPLLTMSNIIQFGKLYGGGFKSARLANNIGGDIEHGFVGKGTTKWGYTKAATKNMLSEGFEEINQKAAGAVAGYESLRHLDMNGGKYDNKNRSILNDFLSAAFNGNMAKGMIDTYKDSSSWEEFAVGALTGLMGMPQFHFVKNSEGKWQSPITIEGGARQDIIDYRKQSQRNEWLAQELNKRIQSPDFKKFYEAAVARMGDQDIMTEAARKGDQFTYETAEQRQLIRDIELFHSAGKLDQLQLMFGQKGDSKNLTSEQIDNLVRETTRTVDGKQFGPYIVKGQRITDDEVREKIEGQRDKFLNTVNTYVKQMEAMDKMYGENISDEALADLTMMRTHAMMMDKRAQSLAHDIFNPRNTNGFAFSATPLRVGITRKDKKVTYTPLQEGADESAYKQVLELNENTVIPFLQTNNRDNQKIVMEWIENSIRNGATATGSIADEDLLQEQKELLLDLAKAIDYSDQYQKELKKAMEDPEGMYKKSHMAHIRKQAEDIANTAREQASRSVADTARQNQDDNRNDDGGEHIDEEGNRTSFAERTRQRLSNAIQKAKEAIQSGNSMKKAINDLNKAQDYYKKHFLSTLKALDKAVSDTFDRDSLEYFQLHGYMEQVIKVCEKQDVDNVSLEYIRMVCEELVHKGMPYEALEKVKNLDKMLFATDYENYLDRFSKAVADGINPVFRNYNMEGLRPSTSINVEPEAQPEGEQQPEQNPEVQPEAQPEQQPETPEEAPVVEQQPEETPEPAPVDNKGKKTYDNSRKKNRGGDKSAEQAERAAKRAEEEAKRKAEEEAKKAAEDKAAEEKQAEEQAVEELAKTDKTIPQTYKNLKDMEAVKKKLVDFFTTKDPVGMLPETRGVYEMLTIASDVADFMDYMSKESAENGGLYTEIYNYLLQDRHESAVAAEQMSGTKQEASQSITLNPTAANDNTDHHNSENNPVVDKIEESVPVEEKPAEAAPVEDFDFDDLVADESKSVASLSPTGTTKTEEKPAANQSIQVLPPSPANVQPVVNNEDKKQEPIPEDEEPSQEELDKAKKAKEAANNLLDDTTTIERGKVKQASDKDVSKTTTSNGKQIALRTVTTEYTRALSAQLTTWIDYLDRQDGKNWVRSYNDNHGFDSSEDAKYVKVAKAKYAYLKEQNAFENVSKMKAGDKVHLVKVKLEDLKEDILLNDNEVYFLANENGDIVGDYYMPKYEAFAFESQDAKNLLNGGTATVKKMCKGKVVYTGVDIPITDSYGSNRKGDIQFAFINDTGDAITNNDNIDTFDIVTPYNHKNATATPIPGRPMIVIPAGKEYYAVPIKSKPYSKKLADNSTVKNFYTTVRDAIVAISEAKTADEILKNIRTIQDRLLAIDASDSANIRISDKAAGLSYHLKKWNGTRFEDEESLDKADKIEFSLGNLRYSVKVGDKTKIVDVLNDMLEGIPMRLSANVMNDPEYKEEAANTFTCDMPAAPDADYAPRRVNDWLWFDGVDSKLPKDDTKPVVKASDTVTIAVNGKNIEINKVEKTANGIEIQELVNKFNSGDTSNSDELLGFLVCAAKNHQYEWKVGDTVNSKAFGLGFKCTAEGQYELVTAAEADKKEKEQTPIANDAGIVTTAEKWVKKHGFAFPIPRKYNPNNKSENNVYILPGFFIESCDENNKHLKDATIGSFLPQKKGSDNVTIRYNSTKMYDEYKEAEANGEPHTACFEQYFYYNIMREVGRKVLGVDGQEIDDFADACVTSATNSKIFDTFIKAEELGAKRVQTLNSIFNYLNKFKKPNGEFLKDDYPEAFKEALNAYTEVCKELLDKGSNLTVEDFEKASKTLTEASDKYRKWRDENSKPQESKTGFSVAEETTGVNKGELSDVADLDTDINGGVSKEELGESNVSDEDISGVPQEVVDEILYDGKVLGQVVDEGKNGGISAEEVKEGDDAFNAETAPDADLSQQMETSSSVLDDEGKKKVQAVVDATKKPKTKQDVQAAIDTTESKSEGKTDLNNVLDELHITKALENVNGKTAIEEDMNTVMARPDGEQLIRGIIKRVFRKDTLEGIDLNSRRYATGLRNLKDSLNIAVINSGKARQVESGLTEREDYEKAVAWLKKTFPNIAEDCLTPLVDNLMVNLENGTTVEAWGRFQNGLITLSKTAAKGTLAHEAFHAVYGLLMTSSERSDIMSIAKSKYNSNDELICEEKLADDFMNYVFKNQNVGKLESWFNRLWTKVKSFFGYDSANLDSMFYGILHSDYGKRRIAGVMETKITSPKTKGYESAKALLNARYTNLAVAQMLHSDVIYDSEETAKEALDRCEFAATGKIEGGWKYIASIKSSVDYSGRTNYKIEIADNKAALKELYPATDLKATETVEDFLNRQLVNYLKNGYDDSVFDTEKREKADRAKRKALTFDGLSVETQTYLLERGIDDNVWNTSSDRSREQYLKCL